MRTIGSGDGIRAALSVITVLVGLAFGVSAASAEAKRAIVIGNNAYTALPALQKAQNDARAIAQTLKDIGFEVTLGENLDRRQTNQMLAKFDRSIEVGDLALVYFAGHGVQVGSQIVLLPVDTPADMTEDQIADEGHAVDTLIRRVQSRGAATSLFILDACRDNPFEAHGRGIGASRGLGRIDAPTGVFTLYSAGIGQTALDRLSDRDTDPNSVFTRQLLPLLHTPGLALVEIAKRLQISVSDMARREANHAQEPAYYDQVKGQIVLLPGKAPAPDATPCGKQGCEPAPRPAPAGPDPETEYWRAQALNTVDAYKSLLDRFPNHPRREAILISIRKIVDSDAAKDSQKQDETLWSDASAKDGPAALEAMRRYTASFPSGLHADEARRKIAMLIEPPPTTRSSVQPSGGDYCVSGLRAVGPNNFLVLRYQPIRDPNGGWDPNIKLFNGERVAVLATEGDFYRIRISNGREGYSAREKILPCAAAEQRVEATPQPVVAPSGECSVAGLSSRGPDNWLALHKGPSLTAYFPPDINLYNGTVLTVLERRRDWFRVRTPDGATGWASSRYIRC